MPKNRTGAYTRRSDPALLGWADWTGGGGSSSCSALMVNSRCHADEIGGSRKLLLLLLLPVVNEVVIDHVAVAVDVAVVVSLTTSHLRPFLLHLLQVFLNLIKALKRNMIEIIII